MKLHFLLSALFLLLLARQIQAQKCRTILPRQLKEVSGMAVNADSSVWLHNDGGSPAQLFLYNLKTRRIQEIRNLPVPNRDWEDLTVDPASERLFIGDFGNNLNRRRQLCIYIYNPKTTTLDSILFTYPDQTAFPPVHHNDWNFDCEAMVYFQDSLHLFSKNVFTGNGFAKHYVLPARPGRQLAELRDSMHFNNCVLTGASLGNDGRTLALVGYHVRWFLGFIPLSGADIYFFKDFKQSNFFKGKYQRRRLPKFLTARQYESVAPWPDGRWLVANEWYGPQKQAVRLIKQK